MEVNQAIRKLLFREDCVIIPGFGGFVSQYRPAVIDKATNTFIPPSKEIVFNSGLVQNDGVLTDYISVNSGLSYEAARELVDRFVTEARAKLESGSPVYIDGIGQFIQDTSQRIRFQADAGTNLFLESFGLAPFRLRQISHENKTAAKPSVIQPVEQSARTVEFVFTEIKKSVARRNLTRIAIAVPVLIAFSLLPYHSRITGSLISSSASMVPEPSLFRLSYPVVPNRDTVKVIDYPIAETMKPDSITSETAPNPGVKNDSPAPVEVQPEVAKPLVGKFPVIAGCFKNRGNAERLHKQLIEKGYPATVTTSKNGQLYKVHVQTFSTRSEAITGLARIKSAEPGMQLWAAL